MTRPIILKMGQTTGLLRARHGDYAAWFAQAAGRPLGDFYVLDAMDPQVVYPDPAQVDGVIISGSAAHVHELEPWSVRAGDWARQVVEAGAPTLGVCYGHQLLGHHFGGAVGPSPNGREMGVYEVTLTPEGQADPLFEGLPSPLAVSLTHKDAVNGLPEGWVLLAHNAHTPVQAMAYGPSCRAVQFHPEFEVEYLAELMRDRSAAIDTEFGAGTAARWLAQMPSSHQGRPVLRNFLGHWLQFYPTIAER